MAAGAATGAMATKVMGKKGKKIKKKHLLGGLAAGAVGGYALSKVGGGLDFGWSSSSSSDSDFDFFD